MTAPTAHALVLQRLDAGPVICAEGYVFELERRGYLQAGAFVPEVVLEHPGGGHATPPRFRSRGIGRRRGAHLLRASREAARDRPRAGSRAHQPARARSRQGGGTETGALFAGDICNTKSTTPPTRHRTRRCGRCSRSRSAGRSTPASTSSSARRSVRAGSADRARRREAGRSKVAVITLAMHQADVTRENWAVADACKRVADAGADVVG